MAKEGAAISVVVCPPIQGAPSEIPDVFSVVVVLSADEDGMAGGGVDAVHPMIAAPKATLNSVA